MTPADVERISAGITDWASATKSIVALAMVGSWARGCARPDSDLDLVLLTTRPSEFRRDGNWPEAIAWSRTGFAVDGWEDASYGAVWSRHFTLVPCGKLELSFAHPSWASLDPIDSGTLAIIKEGCRILLDKAGALSELLREQRPMTSCILVSAANLIGLASAGSSSRAARRGRSARPPSRRR